MIRRPDFFRLLLGWSVLATAATFFPGCNAQTGNGQNEPARAGADAEADQNKTPRVQTAKVQAQNIEQKIKLPGTVEGEEMADLYAKLGGYLESIAVDIGDSVTKNHVLATLAVPEMEKELEQKKAAINAAEAEAKQAASAIKQAEAMVNRAQASLDEAKTHIREQQSKLKLRKSELDRTEDLVTRGALNNELLDEATYQHSAAESALDAVKASVRSAKSKLAAERTNVARARADHEAALARVQLAIAEFQHAQAIAEYRFIRAPFDGVVTRRMVDPGAFIQPAQGNSAAQPLLTVARVDSVRVKLDLPMAQVRWLNQEDRAVLDQINVLPGRSFEGTVTRSSGALNKDSRMMRVEIDLKNPKRELLPGYYGYVTLYLEQLPDTLVVPSSAVMNEGEQKFVFVVQDGRCQKRVVTTNYEDGSIVGVESGLSSGEQVVRAGVGQLVDGQPVIAVEVSNGK